MICFGIDVDVCACVCARVALTIFQVLFSCLYLHIYHMSISSLLFSLVTNYPHGNFCFLYKNFMAIYKFEGNFRKESSIHMAIS